MFNSKDYTSRKPDVANLLEIKTKGVAKPNLRRVAAEIAIATGVPCTVCLEFIAELRGMSEEITDAIRKVNDFYGN